MTVLKVRAVSADSQPRKPLVSRKVPLAEAAGTLQGNTFDASLPTVSVSSSGEASGHNLPRTGRRSASLFGTGFRSGDRNVGLASSSKIVRSRSPQVMVPYEPRRIVGAASRGGGFQPPIRRQVELLQQQRQQRQERQSARQQGPSSRASSFNNDPKLCQTKLHHVRTELQLLLGDHFSELPQTVIDDLIHWKALGSSPRVQNRRPVSVASLPKTSTVRELWPEDSSSPFTLRVKLASGEELPELEGALSSWTGCDILKKLRAIKPLATGFFYRLLYNEEPLPNGISLRGLSLVPSVDIPAVVEVTAVTVQNEEQQALEAALNGVLLLSPADVKEAAALKAPSPPVVLTAAALCSLFDCHPERTSGHHTLDYWALAKKRFFTPGRAKLAESLMCYDIDSDPSSTLQKLSPFVLNPTFEPNRVGSVSLCCERIATWCHTLYKYSQISA